MYGKQGEWEEEDGLPIKRAVCRSRHAPQAGGAEGAGMSKSGARFPMPSSVGSALNRLDSGEFPDQIDGFVYFVQSEGGGLIKIGWAGEPAARLKQLQCASPSILKLMAILPGARSLEHDVQMGFAHLHHHGEWFRPGDDLLKFIEQCPTMRLL